MGPRNCSATTSKTRLRRGHSLEVIFEEEPPEGPPIPPRPARAHRCRKLRTRKKNGSYPTDRLRARSLERLTDAEPDCWTEQYRQYDHDNKYPTGPRRLSQRFVVALPRRPRRNIPEPVAPLPPVPPPKRLCAACRGLFLLPTTMMTDQIFTQQQPPPKRRNSTYLALACANAVSQGAMTRKLSAMFENPPVREQPPLLSRAEIKQAILESRMRRNSIASGMMSLPTQTSPTTDTDPTSPNSPPPAKPYQQQHYNSHMMGNATSPTAPPTPPKPAKPIQNPIMNVGAPVTPPRPKSWISNSRPASVAGEIRCDKCSSILASPPVSPSPPSILEESFDNDVNKNSLGTGKIVVPANREVLEEELPKPDTVKNARYLFESSMMMDGGHSGYSTLQHVKSNPSSKILRSESTMTLDRASIASSRPSTYRWPSRFDQRHRSPSPSRMSSSTSPVPTTPFKNSKFAVAQQAFYYRSTPSLYQNRPPTQPAARPANQQQPPHNRLSRHSTDVESYVSESECWSDHDLDSEAGSYHSSAGRSQHSSTSEPELLEGTRYISPEVMEKIRSYGMTLTFVNGKMVDEDAEEDDDDDDDDHRQPAQTMKAQPMVTQKAAQSVRSAGQSRPTAPATTAQQPSPVKKAGPNVLPKQTPARIVACLVKAPEPEKKRHSSGESSASSGVSSGSGSYIPSPFASLKRTKASSAVAAQHGQPSESDRCPSPVLRSKSARKSTGTSPFGSHSVVYQFSSSSGNLPSNRTPMYV